MNRTIADFHGQALYLDTMIFHLLLREKDSPAELLFRRIQAGDMQAYTSVLTFDELAYRLLLARIRDKYSGSPLDQLRQNEQKLITEFHPEIEAALTRLQTFPNLALLDFTATDLTTMQQNMSQFHLRPRDALHLAAMQKVSCMDLVSHDSDFDAISEVNRYLLA